MVQCISFLFGLAFRHVLYKTFLAVDYMNYFETRTITKKTRARNQIIHHTSNVNVFFVFLIRIEKNEKQRKLRRHLVKIPEQLFMAPIKD